MAKFKHFEDITPAQQIQRWENVVRVLSALTPHERKKHWNMEFWGMTTECGTIACAAGHCGLDPWFNRQGFKLIPAILPKGLKFVNGMTLEDYYGGAGKFEDAPNSDTVHNFFGYEGAEEIFYNDNKRPVTRVIKEVQAYVNKLIADAAAAVADELREKVIQDADNDVDAAYRKAEIVSSKYYNLIKS